MRLALIAATLLLVPLLLTAQETPRAPAPGAPVNGVPGTTISSARRDENPSQGSGVLRGRVSRADTGQAIRRAQVRAQGSESHAALTDDNGRFEIANVPPGSYRISAAKGGFAVVEYGQRRAYGQGRPITLSEGQVVEKIDLVMTPGGVIAGRIVDDAGEPVASGFVSAIRAGAKNRRAEAAEARGVTTDDRGEFRLFGLAPGDYYVLANAGFDGRLPGDSRGYAPTYYPGTPARSEAHLVSLKVGEEIGITFSLTTSRTATVSGIVRNRNGTPAPLAAVTLTEKGDAPGANTAFGATRFDGTFTIANVGTGRYRVDIRSFTNPEAIAAPSDLTVGGADISGLVYELGPGAVARGRIRFDADPPKDLSRDQVRVVAISAEPEVGLDFGSGRMPDPPKDDWTFELTGLTGQRLLQAASFSGTWTLRSVVVDGVDMTDTPIDFGRGDVDNVEVLLTQRVTELSGAVTNDRGAKVVDGTVVAFSPDRDKWKRVSRFIGQTRLDQDGRFQLRGLPPATYVIVAVDDLDQGDERDPEILERLLPQGTRVTLREGEARGIDLKIQSY